MLVLVTAVCTAGALKHKQQSIDQMTVINSNPNGTGPEIPVEFYKGKSLALHIADSIIVRVKFINGAIQQLL